MGLLNRTAQIAEEYLATVGDRPVAATLGYEDMVAALDGPLPERGEDAEDVVEALAGLEPGMMATAGPRYFGFVTGGALPVTVAADWLVATWDGPHFGRVISPAGAAVEDVAAHWLLDALGLPGEARVGFVTGATMANLVGLAAARHRVLGELGWDVEEQGLTGAPPVRVVVGDEVHVSLLKALRILGFGSAGVVRVAVDDNGAMQPGRLAAALREAEGPAIVCAQAGNVNTGACDDLVAAAAAARAAGAWLHVDGAFGLWAAASRRLRHLVRGIELADSWGCDGHKWLNVPYDSGYAFCAHPDVHAEALTYTAAYLTGQVAGRELGGGDFVPESSRRARGFATWAALRSLGGSGVEALVDRCCTLAQRLAEQLEARDGISVCNQVVLNQVLVHVGDDNVTLEVERRVQEEGTCWLGTTTWRGRRLLRVSISNWSTAEADVVACADAIARARTAALA
jgi:glutamate/tyrosine decarboxylase-like PLP-dependent enzyme